MTTPNDQWDEKRAFSLARRRIAYGFAAIMGFLVLADVVIPDDAYNVNTIVLGILAAMVATLLGLKYITGSG